MSFEQLVFVIFGFLSVEIWLGYTLIAHAIDKLIKELKK